MTQDRLFDVPEDPSPVTVTDAQIDEIFLYWVSTHHRRGPRPRMSPLRHRRIAAAIKSYGMDLVRSAIDGCLRSEWHMGINPQQQRYNDISLILRDAGQIEKFAALADDTDRSGW